MTNKITHAPQSVIDELDKYDGQGLLIYEMFESERILTVENKTMANEWAYDASVSDVITRQRELAIINHVFGDEKLQPEREPRWYVKAKDYNGNNVNYFYDNGGNIAPYLRTGPYYDFCMTKGKADLIAKATGGEAKEVK